MTARGLLVIAAACLVTLAVAVGTAWWLRERLRLAPELHDEMATTVFPAIAAWQRRPRETPEVGAALFGDSRLDCRDGVTVGTALAERMRARGRPLDLVEVAHKAFRPLQFYYLDDDVLAGKPAVAIVEINPGHLWPYPPPPLRGVRFLNLSRLLSPREAWRVRGALAADGLTLFDPSIYALEDRLDLLYVVDGVRDRGQQLLDRGGAQLAALLHLDRRPDAGEAGRRRALAEWAHLEPTAAGDVADHGGTIALRALYRSLRRAGVAVLFFVQPTRAPRHGGGPEVDPFAPRLEAVRAAVGATPAEWLDLHAALPGELFRDAGDHLFRDGCERVADAISGALAARPGP